MKRHLPTKGPHAGRRAIDPYVMTCRLPDPTSALALR
jgi:hypothetical protein